MAETPSDTEKSLLAAYFENSDQVLLQKNDEGFSLHSTSTSWFDSLCPNPNQLAGSSAYLDHFLEDAKEHWQTRASTALPSGAFIEVIDGSNYPLEAQALTLNGASVLVVKNLGQAFTNNQKLLQAARENLLNQELLELEVSKRTGEIRGRELEIAERLIYAAGFRDEETGSHIRRIGYYAGAMARALGWNALAVDDIEIAAPMHDIGKIGIPDSILKKPARLNDAEFAIMRNHTTIGRDMLFDSDVPMLRIAADIAGSHHEFWDGSGYPEGLAGNDIPIAARIVSIVDVYDALVHSRVYKSAYQEHVALEMMSKLVGHQFDPELFQVFLDNLDEMRQIRNRVPDTSD